jgi:nucleoside-diphosphate-sugar epimerase
MAGPVTIAITGASGNLGRRLLPLLSGYRILALDVSPTTLEMPGLPPMESHVLDVGKESSCGHLVQLLRASDARVVIHLAFVLDPLRTGVLEQKRMWQINVAGTARVMEAIAEVNRMGGSVRKLIVTGSVSSYGPELPGQVKEDFPLGAHTLTYAVHKKEADEVVQARASQLGECTTYLLRPHMYVGHSMQNYMVGAFRGTPSPYGRLGRWLAAKGKRLPMLLPRGEGYLDKMFQFVHVDDVARVIEFLVRRGDAPAGLEILNVAGRGEPIPIREAIRLSRARVIRLPGLWLCRSVLKKLWDWGISAAPPDCWPYLWGSFCMDITRLKTLLGAEYEQVIRHTVTEALLDDLATLHPESARPDAARAERA